MTDRKVLVKQRSGHSAYAKQVTGNASKLLQTFRSDDKAKLSVHQKTLSERLSIIDSLDNQILSDTNEDEIEEEVIKSGEFRMEIMEVIEHIKDFLINFSSESGHSSTSASTTSSSSSSNAKLPKLKLKPFSGNPLYFQEFLDSFNSAIRENESIDGITKFNYLKNLLTGEASSAISGLSLTADNYDEAMDILHKRFGNKQVLISTHIDKLLTLPVVNSSNNYKQLRDLFDRIEVNIRSLRVLKIHTEENGPILISIIMNKLPNDIKLEISRQMASEREKWEIDDLLRILKREVESRELCFHMSKTSVETSKNKPSSSSAPSTAFALHTSTDNQTERLSCLYCKHEHSSSKCDVVTDPKTRKNILRNKARCFICLKSGHRAKFCRSDYKCYKCNQKHHVSICENQVVRNNENTIPVTRE